MYDTCSGSEIEKIRSLVNLYESIPDYCEINHLPEKEFNSTLNRLKQTLKKRTSTAQHSPPTYSGTKSKNTSIYYCSCSEKLCTKSSTDDNLRTKSVNSIRSVASSNASSGTKQASRKKKVRKVKKITKSVSLNQLHEKMNSLSLRNKSCTEDDDKILIDSSVNEEEFNKNVTSNQLIDSREILFKKSPTKISKPKTAETKKCQFIASQLKNYKELNDKIDRESKTKFLGLDLENSTSMKPKLSPKPVYPAARSNLAAMLRAQLTHRKHADPSDRSEIKKPKKKGIGFNWEVRKAPGWKSLIYSQSHSDDLNYRIATRKAEQKVQSQEYQIHMELMRQRVKSAPLLLEGITCWSPDVSRPVHICTLINKHQNRPSSRSKSLFIKKAIPSLEKSVNKKRHLTKEANLDNDDILSSGDRAFLYRHKNPKSLLILDSKAAITRTESSLRQNIKN